MDSKIDYWKFVISLLYLNNAMSKLMMRIFMKSIWKARSIWVMVASATCFDVLAFEEIISWNREK